MKFSSATTLACTFGLLGATHAAQQSFSVIAARSASPIHLQSVNAADSRFYIGRDTASYCPLTPKSDCPPGNETVFSRTAGSKPGPLGLDVEVPGGQLVYVTKDGALGFTVAHSGLVPEGATTSGFSVKAVKGQSFGQLQYGDGFVACPTKGGAKTPRGPYKVFALKKGQKAPHSNCLGFDALTSKHSNEVAAWQYE